METFLSLRHINNTFHATRALRDVSLDFMSGEVHCLAGQNGCGKSTLIKIMSGVYRPDEGAEITLGGKNWSKLTPAASVAQGIQVIYQDLSLFPNLSVWENIAVNHYHHGLFVNRRRLREVAQAAMTSINVTLPLFGYSGRVRPMKKAHTGESGLKWEAKDSSKLIGNKDHALRGLSSPMAGIRQIRLIT